MIGVHLSVCLRISSCEGGSTASDARNDACADSEEGNEDDGTGATTPRRYEREGEHDEEGRGATAQCETTRRNANANGAV